MSQISILPENCKFAALALQNVRTDICSEQPVRPGMFAVTKLLLPLENHWRLWLGAMQSSNLENCNLFLVSVATSGWPEGQLGVFGGAVDSELMDSVGGLFAFLRIVGAIEYTDAFIVAGHVEDGRQDIRHFARTERFNITRGSLPWVVRGSDLQAAAQLSESYRSLLTRFPGQRWRFARGCHALKTSMEEHYASDRLHGFVRALEALIIPDKGGTEKQFISRCALFAGPATAEAKVRPVLQEVYRMRCDIEHVHDWDRSLTNYPVAEREHICARDRWRNWRAPCTAGYSPTPVFSLISTKTHLYAPSGKGPTLTLEPRLETSVISRAQGYLQNTIITGAFTQASGQRKFLRASR